MPCEALSCRREPGLARYCFNALARPSGNSVFLNCRKPVRAWRHRSSASRGGSAPMWRPRSGWESELGPWVKHCAAPDVRVPILVRHRAAIDQFDEPHPALHEPPRHQALPSEALRAAAFQTVQLERRLGLGRQIEGLRPRSRGSWREARRPGPGRASGRASPGTGRAGPAPAGRSARTGAVRRRARRSPLHGPSPRPAASGGATPGPQLPDPGSRRASSAVCCRALDPPGRTRTAARPAAGPAASWPASGADLSGAHS